MPPIRVMRRRSRQGRGSVRQNGPVRSRHLFALLALAFALGVPGAVQAQVRVMPLGDSITEAETGFDPNTQTYDGVRPNQAGEQMMSDRWFTALGAVLGPSGLIFRDGFETGDTDAWSAILPG